MTPKLYQTQVDDGTTEVFYGWCQNGRCRRVRIFLPTWQLEAYPESMADTLEELAKAIREAIPTVRQNETQ